MHHLQLCFYSVCVHLWCLGPVPFTSIFRVPMTVPMGLVSLQRRLGNTTMALIAPEVITRAMRQCFSAHQTTRHFKDSGYFKVKVSLTSDLKQCKNYNLIGLGKGAPSVLVQGGSKGWSPTLICQSNQKTMYIDTPTLISQTRSTIRAKTMRSQKHRSSFKWPGLLCGDHHRHPCHCRLQTTQLEVETLAFAALNFLTQGYAMWWNKPLNLRAMSESTSSALGQS